MSEVTFAKQLLQQIDKRPIKLSGDHVSDPRKYENQSPTILPRQTHPFPRRDPSAKPPKPKSITATLKPMRAGETVSFPNTGLDTTIHDLKTSYAEKSGVQQDKIKLLLNKKPTADLKTLKELGVSGDVELSVMIMGATAGGTPSATSPAVEKSEAAAAAIPATAKAVEGEKMDVEAPASAAPESEKAQAEVEKEADSSVEGILKTEEFWTDLKGFLAQRLRDEGKGGELTKTFRDAWSKR